MVRHRSSGSDGEDDEEGRLSCCRRPPPPLSLPLSPVGVLPGILRLASWSVGSARSGAVVGGSRPPVAPAVAGKAPAEEAGQGARGGEHRRLKPSPPVASWPTVAVPAVVGAAPAVSGAARRDQGESERDKGGHGLKHRIGDGLRQHKKSADFRQNYVAIGTKAVFGNPHSPSCKTKQHLA
ncbi:hypothetical protein [Oryza sativa Japonica Group]|uniref:Uncharacterized protein n=1 Tax=Oryza sativa subsp. japonica TaxID=39947 RepID=Q5VR24_ORYSJ|nr:hypothetical protein [Oryza sativa Japonica Group]